MTCNLFLIHGAWSSRKGFKYIERNVNYDNIDEVYQFNYDCNKENIATIIRRAKAFLATSKHKAVVLGHSFGGLIGLALHDEEKCASIITLAAPLSGISFPPFLGKIVPILTELSEASSFIRDIHLRHYTKSIHSFITTKGYNPLIFYSDGIISVETQKAWLPSTAAVTYADCNHFEILQRDSVIKAIDRFSSNI